MEREFNVSFCPKSFLSETQRLKPTFGQEHLTIDEFVEAIQKMEESGKVNLQFNDIETELKVDVAILDSFTDYGSICEAFNLTEYEMLQAMANGANRTEEILKFIYDHINTRTVLCNIFIVKQESIMTMQTENMTTLDKQLPKLLLGHSILLCIPLKKQIHALEKIKEIINQVVFNKSVDPIPEFLSTEAMAIIDYDETLQQSAYKLLKKITTFNYPETLITLFLEYHDKNLKKLHNVTTAKLALSTILNLKQYIWMNEEKFSFKMDLSDTKDEQMISKNELENYIVTKIATLEDSGFKRYPPPILENLYMDCKTFERQYYKALNDDCQNYNILNKLEESLKSAYSIVAPIPFKKYKNGWLIEIDDTNAEDIKKNYLLNEWILLVTEKTRNMIRNLFNEQFLWVLSAERNAQNLSEPMFICGKHKFLLGMVTPAVDQKSLNGYNPRDAKFFIDFCSCTQNLNERKIWICIKCRTTIKIDSCNVICCNCSIYHRDKLIKNCFKCAFIEVDCQNNNNNLNASLSTANILIENVEEESVKEESICNPESTLVDNGTMYSSNVLFIGQSGAGKSLLVNSIYNYMAYSFDEILNAETSISCLLPVKFQLQKANFENVIFTNGPKDVNENFNDGGHSVTQKPKIHEMKIQNHKFNFIDTPGLGDTRGGKQDETNLILIRDAIIGAGKIDAISFVMPSNITKLSPSFEVHMRDLLSLFPKTALKNVYFFFTFSNLSSFTIGDTRSPLEEFISSFETTNNAKIPFGPENVYCVDSEALMYFIATKNGHYYQNRSLESFRISWEKSKAAIERFSKSLENVESVTAKNISMIYELEELMIKLKDEPEQKIEQLIIGLMNATGEISMISKFNKIKTANEINGESPALDDLFKGLKLCERYVNAELQKSIKSFIDKYDHFNEMVADPKITVETIEKVPETKKFEKEKYEFSFELFKNVAKKLANIWIENEKNDYSCLKEAIFQIQLFSNLETLNQIKMAELKDALDQILALPMSDETKDDITNLSQCLNSFC